ncbi:MAG: hypothetical protein ACP5GO_04770 [Thermoprotei archaeon]|jgi:DNA-directed RNA polymerase subunit RPC12/RpoP
MSETQYPVYQCITCGYVLTDEDWKASGLLISKFKCPRCGGRVFIKLTNRASRITHVV